MKHSHRCPKCDGRKLWRIEKFRHATDVVGGAELPVAIIERERIWTGATSLGSFDMWICDACGYSELWANGLSQLAPKPDEGVHLVDGRDAPYR